MLTLLLCILPCLPTVEHVPAIEVNHVYDANADYRMLKGGGPECGQHLFTSRPHDATHWFDRGTSPPNREATAGDGGRT